MSKKKLQNFPLLTENVIREALTLLPFSYDRNISELIKHIPNLSFQHNFYKMF